MMPVPDRQMVCSRRLAPKSPSFTLPTESRRIAPYDFSWSLMEPFNHKTADKVTQGSGRIAALKPVKGTHARHVLHEDGERPLHGVSQAAVVLDDPLVAQVLQQLDLTLQSADLLEAGHSIRSLPPSHNEHAPIP
ncbi:hypothetical protein EYF80_005290 [Liparis tanakae]|uniref:Uncharacterized protein n=1 Tax=Liparis tanakae TaxID=230148 RepID=A0A4Z2J303_9TELE|nr:hypothetical protein EYF80_005290 [Liparis tanakae]